MRRITWRAQNDFCAIQPHQVLFLLGDAGSHAQYSAKALAGRYQSQADTGVATSCLAHDVSPFDQSASHGKIYHVNSSSVFHAAGGVQVLSLAEYIAASGVGQRFYANLKRKCAVELGVNFRICATKNSQKVGLPAACCQPFQQNPPKTPVWFLRHQE